MAKYRVYLLNAYGSIMRSERLDCADDQMAVRRAMAALEKDPSCGGFELWQATRCVHVYPARKPMYAG